MKLLDITYVALLAAFMGALGFVPPIMLSFTPVPITLQTLGVLLAGGILGAKRGFLSMMIFLLLVAAGAPLISGGRGGFAVFLGPSAGYLISWPITALCLGYLISRFSKLRFGRILFINLTVGIFMMYIIGIPVQAFILHIKLTNAIITSLVYIPGDVLKATLASYLVYRLAKSPAIKRNLHKENSPIDEPLEAKTEA
ncbi:biotin transporter BioY [Bacillus sp. MUM 116]|uniref:biotin transporter BioY n=1 Tax=Bacillus sp. MUM 116 TaxID=1678002 RepID=UPI0008F5E1F3|nr:biotin transporter BioY [Bacillus sp. MUM 116]OIK16271.1 biotin transporter BioY [Bacillus sp. MUM 116]